MDQLLAQQALKFTTSLKDVSTPEGRSVAKAAAADHMWGLWGAGKQAEAIGFWHWARQIVDENPGDITA